MFLNVSNIKRTLNFTIKQSILWKIDNFVWLNFMTPFTLLFIPQSKIIVNFVWNIKNSKMLSFKTNFSENKREFEPFPYIFIELGPKWSRLALPLFWQRPISWLADTRFCPIGQKCLLWSVNTAEWARELSGFFTKWMCDNMLKFQSSSKKIIMM